MCFWPPGSDCSNNALRRSEGSNTLQAFWPGAPHCSECECFCLQRASGSPPEGVECEPLLGMTSHQQAILGNLQSFTEHSRAFPAVHRSFPTFLTLVLPSIEFSYRTSVYVDLTCSKVQANSQESPPKGLFPSIDTVLTTTDLGFGRAQLSPEAPHAKKK